MQACNQGVYADNSVDAVDPLSIHMSKSIASTLYHSWYTSEDFEMLR